MTEYIDDKHIDKVLEILQGEGDIQFYIEDKEITVTNYLFTVQTSNFKELYSWAQTIEEIKPVE